MANETRPRRESSSTSRIRKAPAPPPPPAAPADAGQDPVASNPHASAPDAVEPSSPAGNDYRDREPFRPVEERPAAREPIRLIRARTDRESGVPVRERLAAARERGDRDREPGPVSRDRDREPGPV